MRINEHNYQSYLLDYVDGELREAEKLELLQYMAEHPEAGEQLELLQKTKPEAPETMVFPNKTALYRTERQPKRPLRIAWKRWMAGAAALLLLLIATRLYMQQGETSLPPVSKDQPLATHIQGSGQQRTTVPVPRPETESPRQRPQQLASQKPKRPEKARTTAQQPETRPPAAASAPSPGASLAANQQATDLAAADNRPSKRGPIRHLAVSPIAPDTAAAQLASAPLSPAPNVAEATVTLAVEPRLKTDPINDQTARADAEPSTNQQADALLTRSLQKLRANKESLDSSFTDKILALHDKITHPIKALNIKKISIGNVSFVFN